MLSPQATISHPEYLSSVLCPPNPPNPRTPELAAVVGVDPGPLTLGELLWMAEARGRDNWAHTSAILALVANVNRDPKKTRAYKPADFDPYAAKDRRDEAIEVTDMATLKDAFCRVDCGKARDVG